jgi:hypothetical protein
MGRSVEISTDRRVQGMMFRAIPPHEISGQDAAPQVRVRPQPYPESLALLWAASCHFAGAVSIKASAVFRDEKRPGETDVSAGR